MENRKDGKNEMKKLVSVLLVTLMLLSVSSALADLFGPQGDVGGLMSIEIDKAINHGGQRTGYPLPDLHWQLSAVNSSRIGKAYAADGSWKDPRVISVVYYDNNGKALPAVVCDYKWLVKTINDFVKTMGAAKGWGPVDYTWVNNEVAKVLGENVSKDFNAQWVAVYNDLNTLFPTP